MSVDNKKIKYLNGDIYEGYLENGKKQGYGKMIYSYGDIYDGYWKNDNKHGNGTLITSKCNIYDGEWIAGMLYSKKIYSLHYWKMLKQGTTNMYELQKCILKRVFKKE
jgi:hypothetical protein